MENANNVLVVNISYRLQHRFNYAKIAQNKARQSALEEIWFSLYLVIGEVVLQVKTLSNVGSPKAVSGGTGLILQMHWLEYVLMVIVVYYAMIAYRDGPNLDLTKFAKNALDIQRMLNDWLV